MTRLTIPAPMIRFPRWREHAPDGTLLWVDLAAQRLWVLESFVAIEVVRCSTAAAGPGEREGSGCTPRGWHAVGERIGGELPVGAVLRGRRWTGACWSPERGLVAQGEPTGQVTVGAGEADGRIPDAAAVGTAAGLASPAASAGAAEDLVLSRILWLDGREPGRNRGGDVDTRRRFIYVHGTNHPEALGTPASHGCVRLACADVVRLHGRVGAGHPVWIG